MKNHIALLLLLSFSFIGNSFSQGKYQEKTKVDGVSIYYKWSHQNPVDKSSPLQMVFKMTNENNKAASVSFSVDYYIDGILKETNKVDQFCIKANKTANGRFSGLVFSTANISNSQIKSESFSWELNDHKIEILDACPEK